MPYSNFKSFEKAFKSSDIIREFRDFPGSYDKETVIKLIRINSESGNFRIIVATSDDSPVEIEIDEVIDGERLALNRFNELVKPLLD